MLGVLEGNTLGQMRTGAASAVATKYLARSESRVMTIFGSGWQAESQLEGVSRVLPRLEHVNVLGRSHERSRRFASMMAERLDLEVTASANPEQAVALADVITTITGAREPLFDGHWLRPGVHINAAGSNFADKHGSRCHQSLSGGTPLETPGEPPPRSASLVAYGWRQHCRGLFQTPIPA